MRSIGALAVGMVAVAAWPSGVSAGTFTTATIEVCKVVDAPEWPEDLVFYGSLFWDDSEEEPFYFALTEQAECYRTPVAPGTWFVAEYPFEPSESEGDPWFIDLTCWRFVGELGEREALGQPVTGSSITGVTASIDIGPGDDIVCELVNTAPARIAIRKLAPEAPSGLDFEFSASGSFGESDFELAHNEVFVLPPMRPGLVTVAENELSGWQLASIDCVEPNDRAGFEVGASSVEIELEVGADLTCTFTNQPTVSSTTTSTSTTSPTTTTDAGGGAGTPPPTTAVGGGLPTTGGGDVAQAVLGWAFILFGVGAGMVAVRRRMV